jgi:uncharacterized protein
MTIAMYSASVPVFQRQLRALGNVLDKGTAFAASKKMKDDVVLQLRLYPDMLPFVSQIRIASDFAKNTPALLAGVEPPKFEDNEATLAECKARIDKTLAYIGDFRREQIDGSDAKDITRTIGGNPMTFKGEVYLEHFAMPNFYFHCSTAYAILRGIGVEVGKRDFIGGLQ